MNKDLSLDDIIDAFKAHGYKFLSYNEKKIGGHTFKNPTATKITFLNLTIKKADGTLVLYPVVDIGLQMIKRVSSSLPGGADKSKITPDFQEKIDSNEIVHVSPKVNFTALTIEEIEAAIPPMNSKTLFDRKVSCLKNNNEKLIYVAELLEDASYKLVQELASTSAEELGFSFRHTKKRDAYVCATDLDFGETHFGLRISEYSSMVDGKSVTRTFDPIYKFRLPTSKINPLLIQAPTWLNRKKNHYVPLIVDYKLQIAKDKKQLPKDQSTEFLYNGDPITTNNLERAIPRKSIIAGKIELEHICMMATGGTSVKCTISKMLLSPNPNSGFGPAENEYKEYNELFEDDATPAASADVAKAVDSVLDEMNDLDDFDESDDL